MGDVHRTTGLPFVEAEGDQVFEGFADRGTADTEFPPRALLSGDAGAGRVDTGRDGLLNQIGRAVT
ncbi:MAG TPA: hypothetical protein VF960_10880 [Chloroflexota bacterium]